MNEKLKNIARLSNHYGADPAYVFLGGGNTSVKDGDRLYIKPSGVQLASIRPEQFLEIDRTSLARLFDTALPTDVQAREALAKDILMASVRPFGAGRPSVETPLHHLFQYTYVVHLHPALVNGMTCAVRGRETCARLFPDALWMDYCDAGAKLAFEARTALEHAQAERGAQPKVVFLQNHGVFVAADTPEEVEAIYAHLTDTLTAAYQTAGVDTEWPVPEDAATQDVLELAPRLRQLLADETGRRPFVRNLGLMDAFAGPLTPDHIVYAKSFAYSGEAEPVELAAFVDRHGYRPKVVCVPGRALFTVADSLKSAQSIAIAVVNARYIEQLSQAFGGPKYLNEREYTFIENWEVESYRSKMAASGAAAGRLDGRIAVVTGGAQGFGLGIAECLAAEGATLVIADMNAEGAAATAQQLCDTYGAGRAIAVPVNVSSEESVEQMVACITDRCGGIDLFVANAGVVRAGSVKEMSLKDWQFVTDINYTGYFLCVKHAARVMARQRVNGEGRWTDIVQVNSKSGLEGSNKNGAYAGSKFGTIGLTQSFAKELVEDGIKVNSVCPGNYLDGPLWSHPEKGLFVQYLHAGKVPGAKTIADVRRFYEAKVPMGRGCLPKDVARAIMYCVEQDYETGQAIPVTGGQIMLH